MERKQYGMTFALAYDELNSDADYSGLCDFVEKIFARECSKKPAYIAELACGTGNASIGLAKRGYRVIASDISEEMLSVADKKASNDNVDVRFVKADMRSFQLYSKVDAVFCFFDSINYLTKKEDVKSCFAHTHKALNDNGLFIFDVNSKRKFEKVYADNAYVLETEGILCAWQNYYNEKSKLCDFYLSVFTENEDGTYLREDETQREKMYTTRQLSAYLSEAGFEIIDCVSDFSCSKADESADDRLYFICRKR